MTQENINNCRESGQKVIEGLKLLPQSIEILGFINAIEIQLSLLDIIENKNEQIKLLQHDTTNDN